MNNAPAALRLQLDEYEQRWPDEADVVRLFTALLDDPRDPFVRDRLEGHFTASAWLVDSSATRVLLTHHRKLGRWLQLGGHADGDRDLVRVALREAGEESGLTDLRVVPGIYDVDRHRIPEHNGVPSHWHYDVRYVIHATREDVVVSDESHALAWRAIDAIAADTNIEWSLRRMAEKWLGRS